MLKVLLDNGCKADYVFKGYTVHTSALVLSSIRNSFKCLEILLQSGAKDNTVDGYTAYTWAKYLGWSECLNLLENVTEEMISTDCTFVSNHSVTLGGTESFSSNHIPSDCVSETVSSSDCEMTGVHTLSQYLAPPIISVWGLIQWMDISDTLRRLIEQGQNVNAQDQFGRTSLHFAVEEQSRTGLRTLLQLGANPELRDSCDATPFWHAVYWNKRSMIQELIFANVTMESKARKDAFKLGVPWQNIHILAPGNTETHYKSPLYFAVKKNWILTASLLLEAGYNIKDENIEELLSNSKEEMRSVLLEYIHQPRSLLDLTRNFVRKFCGIRIHKLLEGVDIPVRIKDCLLLRDVVDLKIEPVLVHL